MTTTYKDDAARRPHPSRTQPRRRDGKWNHREPFIAKLAATRPGTLHHTVALMEAGEILLKTRRKINSEQDVWAHNPHLLHDTIALGHGEYNRAARAAGLGWHRPFMNQLLRWGALDFLRHMSTVIDEDDWPPQRQDDAAAHDDEDEPPQSEVA